MGGGHAGPITEEARGVLVISSGGDDLPALSHGVLGGRVLWQLGSSLHVREGRLMPNPLEVLPFGQKKLRFCKS